MPVIPNWMDYLNRPDFDPNQFTPGTSPSLTARPWQSPQVAAPQAMAGPGSAAIDPLSAAPTPSPDVAGLYAIYGRKNLAQARADRYSRMAGMDMGGRLGQLPGIVATLMAGRAQKQADIDEAKKEADIKSFMDQKKAYDKIKGDRETRQSNAKYLTDTIFPAATQEYLNVLRKTKDLQAASAAATTVANKMAADQGIPAPEVVAFNAWKGATTFAVINEKGKTSTAIYKDGALMIQDEKGDMQPPTEKWLSIKDVSDLMDAQAKIAKASVSALKGKEHIYLTGNNELLYSTDPEAAKKQGAIKVMVDVHDEDGVKTSKEYFLPGMGPKAGPAPTTASVTPTPRAPESSPTPVVGGGMAGFVAGRGRPEPTAPTQKLERPNLGPGSPGYKYKTETLGTDGKTKIGTDDMKNWYIVRAIP